MTYTVRIGTIEEQVIPGKRLGRRIHHDSRSLAYPYRAGPGSSPVTVLHMRRVPIFDQGNAGSCTGQAITGACGSDPDYSDLPDGHPALDEAEALRLYSAAELIDGDGPYPPHDNGSSGLSVCKAAAAVGLIAGYTHALTLTDALVALAGGPVITGVNWYDSFDHPDSTGYISLSPGASVRGGHEFVVRGCDTALQTLLCDNSWGTSWGRGGSFTMGWGTWERLLSEQGDVTVPVPAAQPAPVPVPVPVPTPPPAPGPAPGDADLTLAKTAVPWVGHRPPRRSQSMADALTVWLQSRGLY